MTTKDIKMAKGLSRPSQQIIIAVRGFTDTNLTQWVEIEYNGKSALVEYRIFAVDRGGVWASLSHKGVVIVPKAVKANLPTPQARYLHPIVRRKGQSHSFLIALSVPGKEPMQNGCRMLLSHSSTIQSLASF